MSLLRRESTPAAGGGMEDGGDHPRCRRQLFVDDYGQPGATDNLMNVFHEELQRARAAARERWNFDFARGRPLEGSWQWEAVGAAEQQGQEGEDEDGEEEEVVEKTAPPPTDPAALQKPPPTTPPPR